MNDIVKVIPMSPAHIPALAALERECFSDPWSEKALAEELDVPSAVFLTALMGEEVAGYMGAHYLGDSVYVCNIAVFPAFRRQSVASALLAAHMAEARERGMKEITLEVRVSNAAARSLYEKWGFENRGIRPRFYSDPEEGAAIYTLAL